MGVELLVTGCMDDSELDGPVSGRKGICLDLNWLVGGHLGRTLVDYEDG